MYKRLLISSRNSFDDGATAETATVYRMQSKNEQLAHKNVVFTQQDQMSNANAKMRWLRERSGARKRKFPWLEWQVHTNQTSRTEYNRE